MITPFTKIARFILINIEKAFFIRTDSIKSEHDCTELQEIVRSALDKGKRLIFLSYEVNPFESVKLYNHLDRGLKKGNNPRVVVPKELYPNFYNQPAAVNFCSFGIRAPKSTKENPNYGVIGMGHILNVKQFLAWNLCCPLGSNNPSTQSGGTDSGLTSEGVGAFEAFLAGDRIAHANAQWKIYNDVAENTTFGLFPNQHIGAFEVNWPQKFIRDGLVSSKFAQLNEDNLEDTGSSILGKNFKRFDFQGEELPNYLLNPRLQEQLGEAAYNEGCAKLERFFWETLGDYLNPMVDVDHSTNHMEMDPDLRNWIIEFRQ